MKAGVKQHALYMTWANIKTRCFNIRNRAYPWYGGRGLGMHTPWAESFCQFLADILGEIGPRPEGFSIECIDNNLGYFPGTVKWADRYEQANNRRNNRMLEFLGQSLTVPEFSRMVGLNQKTVANRIRLGWPLSKLADPCNTRKRNKNARHV